MTDEIQCIICMDDESSATPIITTPCFHTYHRNCLTSWIVYSNTCPTCRGTLIDTNNPWCSMSLYERITNYLLLLVSSSTLQEPTSDVHPAYFLS